MLAETNKLFQLSFKYFHIFHCNILYFIHYHLLIHPPYTFPPSITFFYTTLFPFISIIHSIIFFFILPVHFYNLPCFLICSIGTIMQGYYYLSSTIVYDVSRRSSSSFLYISYVCSLFVYLYSYTLFLFALYCTGVTYVTFNDPFTSNILFAFTTSVWLLFAYWTFIIVVSCSLFVCFT